MEAGLKGRVKHTALAAMSKKLFHGSLLTVSPVAYLIS